MLGYDELFMPDLAPGGVICSNDPVNCSLGASHTLITLAYDEHMLLVFIIWLRSCILLLRVLSSDENLAACLFLQSLLVKTFGPNEHADVVDPGVLRDVNLLLDF